MAGEGPYRVVFDNHFHLRHDGPFLDAVRRFRSAGGTAINLTNLPDYSISPETYYSTIYRQTIQMAEKIRTETGIFVMVTVGPYPLDYFYFKEGKKDPVAEMLAGVDLGVKLFNLGKIQAIGEIGTPHFTVDEDIYEEIRQVLTYAFQSCADQKIPVVLHTEDLTAETVKSICATATKCGMDCRNVVKHHATTSILGNSSKMTVSLPASRSNVREGIRLKAKFMLETDYVNDPEKPDRVMPPDAVPRRAAFIKQEFEDSERILEDIFVNTPKEAYGFSPSATLNK